MITNNTQLVICHTTVDVLQLHTSLKLGMSRLST